LDAQQNLWVLPVTIGALAGIVELLLAYRSLRMRVLARRLGWTYTPGNNHVWKLLFRHKMYPMGLRLSPFSPTTLWGTMNIIEGNCRGIRMIVLDSLFHFGIKNDRYITFIGAKTEADPFLLRRGKEKVAHSNGWFVLSRTRFSILTWSLSVKRIEDHLRALGS
jgi:hypothetical protein